MKKILLVAAGSLLISASSFAQDSDSNKKVRVGLRVAGQPSWFKSNDNNTTKSATGFGFGFGLQTEFRLTSNLYFLTGIGGDFENGKIKYRQDLPNNYSTVYYLDSGNSLVYPKDFTGSGSNKAYFLKERQLKTSYVTIPIALKMITNEYSGFKYFGVFGGELAYRIKALANDVVNESTNLTTDVTISKLNVNQDASLIPLRVGMNVGAGVEYRIAGSTSVFLSVNYFRGFTNTMRKESKYVVYAYDSQGYHYIKQSLFANAIRINVGILF